MTLIRRDRRDHIEVRTLDRPDRLNALPDPEDGEAFAAAREAVNADLGVRCVILTGAGRASRPSTLSWR
jgi:2-(1,2-epoxy-1,2-dihydrophenyl)acetyl-CoA isomerase